MSWLRAAFVALVLSVPAAAHAFTDEVHEDVAEQAARLMPSSLRSILAQNLPALRRGAAAVPRVAETGLFLYPDGAYGTLDQAVARQQQRVEEMLAQRAPMVMLAEEFGALSRLVALASDPIHVVPHDARTADWARSFEAFVEQRRPKFRVAFGGYGTPELDRGDLAAFVRASAERTRLHAPLLREMFLLPDGKVASIVGFDDRPPEFGIASMSYSHAITDTARAWLLAWIKAGGDTAGLPFPQALPAGSTP